MTSRIWLASLEHETNEGNGNAIWTTENTQEMKVKCECISLKILDKKKAYMPDNLDKTCKIYLKWIVYLQVAN